MATPIFCCGLECGRIGSGLHLGVHAGTASISTTTVRNGARSLRCNPAGAAQQVTVSFATASTKLIGRVYILFTTLPSGPTNLLAGLSGYMRFESSDSKIYARFSTTNGASGVSVTTGQWYRIDFQIDNAVSGTCDVQVDGVACGQATGTGSGGGFSSAQIGSEQAITADIFFDDMLFSQTAADYPLGAGYVNHFVPTADGTHNVAGAADFKRGAAGIDITNATTDAYLLVDEVPLDDTTPDTDDYINAIAPPNATDYVEVLFGPAPGISTPTAGPRSAQVILAYHQAATTTGNIRLALNDNGTTDDVLNQTAAGVTTIRYAGKHYADPPSVATTWGIGAGNGNFNNVRMRFYSSDAVPDQYFDCAMIEAEFVEEEVAFDAALIVSRQFGQSEPMFSAVRTMSY